MKKVCFTGHRKVAEPEKIYRRLTELLEQLISEGAEDFYAGGAVGFDTPGELAVLELRKKYPGIRLHLVLPCPNNDQTAGWSYEQRADFHRILAQADTVEYTSDRYRRGCMKLRNARLTELADICVCYYRKIFKSGTGQTLRMAESKGIKIYNLADNTKKGGRADLPVSI